MAEVKWSCDASEGMEEEVGELKAEIWGEGFWEFLAIDHDNPGCRGEDLGQYWP